MQQAATHAALVTLRPRRRPPLPRCMLVERVRSQLSRSSGRLIKLLPAAHNATAQQLTTRSPFVSHAESTQQRHSLDHSTPLHHPPHVSPLTRANRFRLAQQPLHSSAALLAQPPFNSKLSQSQALPTHHVRRSVRGAGVAEHRRERPSQRGRHRQQQLQPTIHFANPRASVRSHAAHATPA